MNLRLHIWPLLFVVALTSCSPAKNESTSKSESEEYEIVTKQEINLADFFLQEEEDYLVFCHSDTCQHCKEIIGDVAAFAEDNIAKTYFLCVSKEGNHLNKVSVDEITIGVSELEDLCYAGTPTIFEVEKGVTTANIPGKDKCLTFLNELRKNDKEEISIA